MVADEGTPGTPRFRRLVEDFTCGRCGADVTGDGYTNHCPQCLWSRHVDINPGDRAASCGGLMAPLSAMFVRDQVVLVQRCVACGHTRRNRTSSADDAAELRLYLGRPVTPP